MTCGELQHDTRTRPQTFLHCPQYDITEPEYLNWYSDRLDGGRPGFDSRLGQFPDRLWGNLSRGESGRG
jgi:hypothetical protein